MVIKIFKLAILIFSFIITGCVSEPTKEELASINYGPYPTNFKKIIENHLSFVLKDPDSMKVRYLKQPTKLYYLPSGGGKYNGAYSVCALVNAKNGFGGYSGGKLSWFLIKNNAVIDYEISSNQRDKWLTADYCREFITPDN